MNVDTTLDLERLFGMAMAGTDAVPLPNFRNGIQINGTLLDATEFGRLNGLTAGTVTASKLVAVDENKDISAFRNVGLVNLDAGSSGVAGSVDIFPSTASKGKTTFTASDNAGNTTTTVNTAAQAGARTYTVPDAMRNATFMFYGGSVTDAGPMTATGGSVGEVVTNTSDSKQYICTVAHASAATWVALN